jgi:SH3 domain-containing YSC84-like protein 1
VEDDFNHAGGLYRPGGAAWFLRKDKAMNKKITVLLMCLAMSAPLFAQEKEDERLANSATALQQILSENNGLPKSILNQAVCVVIYPNVKKVALGIMGTSYGRGELICRKGASMNGSWGAPAMYSLDSKSLGVALGGTETDFVLVVMNQKGAEQILNGKVKIGSNATAAAGPTGAQATSYNAQAMNTDVLTYSRSKGVFAGISMEGAKMDNDNDANKAIYGKELSAKAIVSGGEQVPSAAKPLIDLLDKTSPARK